MTGSINLFLISTPLQLINAIEVKSRFNIPDSSSVLIILAYSINLVTLKMTINHLQWKEVYFIKDDLEYLKKHEKNVQKGRIFSALKVVVLNLLTTKRLIRKFKRVCNLIVGNYSNLEQLNIINRTEFENLILLDDGIGTIDINNRRKGNISMLRNFSNSIDYKTWFKMFFLGYKIQHPKSACFFTIYDVLVSSNDKIIKNEFKEAKKMIKGSGRTNEVYLLGGPYSEIYPELLSEEIYFDYIIKAKAYFAGKNLIYIPHKAESAEKLNRVEFDLGISIRRMDMPIELFLLHQKEIPDTIAGFLTSALTNCKGIFGDGLKIISIKINNDKIVNKSLIRDIENVYDYFYKISDDKFNVISVD